jgi:hypothetical protein
MDADAADADAADADAADADAADADAADADAADALDAAPGGPLPVYFFVLRLLFFLRCNLVFIIIYYTYNIILVKTLFLLKFLMFCIYI